ncbi:MAG TPA: XdhC family protein [Steroidobacteraceae bacterium]|nr:XdhC family protein [Steroidobacteraceae bacterium]
MSLHRLIPLFERARSSDEPLVLATVIRTAGSTYAKPGALMLIAADGEYAGLLSGGCLEGDLREHAREVIASGEARIVSYDLRSQDDQLFGLGAGCEGAMDILLTRHGPAPPGTGGWQPLAMLERAFRLGHELRIAFVTQTGATHLPLGMWIPAQGDLGFDASADPTAQAILEGAARAPGNTLTRLADSGIELFVAAVAPPPQVLLLGGGPDARPVAALADFLGWRVTVVDHRSAYLDPARFPAATRLVESPATALAEVVRFADFSAAIVMSHHLESDLHYLRALAYSGSPYVGLLGPAARREKLLADLGEPASALRARLRAPVGLDIGGRTPEAIALAIVGEVQAALAGRGGRPFSETAQ